MELTFHARYSDGVKKFEGLDQYYGAQSLLALSQKKLDSLIARPPRSINLDVAVGIERIMRWL